MKKILLVLFLSTFTLYAFAQERTVSGSVLSEDEGVPIPGVNVILKGSSVGTITDIEGKYVIQVPESGGTLVFSFIGLTTEEVVIGSQSTIDMVMTADIRQLTEVVVTAFGIERDKKALGYSVQNIGSEEIVKSQARSPLQSLQGKVAGVQITNASGAPGASTNVVLRGFSSISGNNEALYIIDGIPVNNSNNNGGGILTGAVDGGNAVNDLNPDDIESVNVLKGASAAALYGSRAAQGVIIITTKKGKDTAGKINVDYNFSYNLERVLVLPELQNSFGQGQQGDYYNFTNDQESWGPSFSGFEGRLVPIGITVLDPNSEFFNKQRFGEYRALDDNIREFFEVGNMFTNNIAISGGGDRGRFRFSFSDLLQKGVVPGSELRRNTASVVGGTSITEKFSIDASLNYVKQKNDLVINGQGGEAPYSQVLQTSRSFSLIDQRDLSNPYNGVDWYYTPFIQNPYFNLFNDSYIKDLNRFYGNVNLDYFPIKEVKLTARIGTDIISDDRKRFKDKRIASELSPNSSADEQGQVREEAYTNRQIDVNLYASYNKTFSENYNLNVLLGYNYNQRSTRAFRSEVNNIAIPGFSNISNGAEQPSTVETVLLRRLIGVFGQVDFSYKNFVFLGFSYRNDWSSTLPTANNSFGYPSANASFVFTDAFDMGISNILSFGKIRVGYAEVGNDAPPYRTESVFVATQGGAPGSITGNFGRVDFPLDSIPGFSEGNTIGAPNLKPERSREWEFGIDIRMWNGRFGIDYTYFDKLSKDQIITVAAPPSSGFSFQTLNAGEIENKGHELLITGTAVKSNSVTWDISLNWTKINNKVLSSPAGDITIGTGLANYQLKVVEGQPYGIFEGFTALRDPDGNLIVNDDGLPQQAPQPGRFGSVLPDWLGGVSTTFSWKDLSLSMTFDHKQGGKVYSRTVGQTYFNGTAVETAFNNRERFIVPFSVVDNGDGTFSPNTVPLTYASNNIRNYWNALNAWGETLIREATFTKLREITLTYNFPSGIIERTPFRHLIVGLFGRNIWIHTPDDNTYIDPEVNSFTAGNTNNGNLTGFEFGTTPSTSTYGINLKLGF